MNDDDGPAACLARDALNLNCATCHLWDMLTEEPPNLVVVF